MSELICPTCHCKCGCYMRDSCECDIPTNQWTKCTPETLPDRNEQVLLIDNYSQCYIAILTKGNKFENFNCCYPNDLCSNCEIENPVAWMPLPPPPEE